jgi:hypothetical protein
MESAVAPTTVAIMQPYFIPYLGYFRLFAVSDLFVIYDCVQFPRRGWVHRNRLVDASGAERWLTLPLEKGPRELRIKDLRFLPNAASLFEERLRRFPLIEGGSADNRPIIQAIRALGGSPVAYIENVLKHLVDYLGLPWRVLRSSTLDVPTALRGQDRIIEIVRRLGACRYVNAPGGQALYDTATFADAGIDLRFLPPYEGSLSSILGRVMQEDRKGLIEDLHASLKPAN